MEPHGDDPVDDDRGRGTGTILPPVTYDFSGSGPGKVGRLIVGCFAALVALLLVAVMVRP